MLEFNATFFVAMFSFIIFMLVMNSILYKPLKRISAQREKLISDNYSDAKLTCEKSDDLKAQHELSIEKASKLAKENFNKKVSAYKSQKESLIESAKNLAKKDLEISQAELEGDKKEAKLLLKSQLVELSNLVASKVLGYQSDIKDIDEQTVNSCMN
jgi:F-type H+-transporting ATPase subunit b